MFQSLTPLHVAADGGKVGLWDSLASQHPLDSAPQRGSIAGQPIPRAGWVKLAAIRKASPCVEEEKVRCTRRTVRAGDVLGLVEHVRECPVPVTGGLGHSVRGVFWIRTRIIAVDGHQSPALPVRAGAQLRELLRDMIHEGTVIAHKGHQRRNPSKRVAGHHGARGWVRQRKPRERRSDRQRESRFDGWHLRRVPCTRAQTHRP